MQSGQTDRGDVRRQLERLLSSRGLARNDRLGRFLRFVVERHLEGRSEELKESVIAVEVFGRSTEHDPRQDSIVRTEAGRLRARLNEYYLDEGKDDPLVIDLPKGGYVPLIRQADLPTTDEHQTAVPVRSRRLRWLKVGAATTAAVTAATLFWWWTAVQGRAIAIAVLPLENLSRDPANEYFADGLTDELIRELSMIDGLAPRSRTSSFAFKGKKRTVREAGAELQADYIVEGSVMRAGQQLRVNARLVRVRDDFPLWSGKFDRELTDLFAIQDEISRGIVNNLRLKLGRGRRRYETSTEAYDLYLRARAADFRQSVPLFEQAIARDESFAPAYAGLAAAYAYRTGTTQFDREDELVKMRAAAERAIQLDALLAEAHDALGLSYARDGQWQQAEQSFRRSIELDPNRSATYIDYAHYVLLPLGRIGDAVRQVRFSERLDPLSSTVHFGTAYVLLSAGMYDEAVKLSEKITIEQTKSMCLGRAFLGQGRVDDAIAVFKAAIDRGVPAGAPIRGYLGYAFGRAGRREDAERIAVADSANPFHQLLVFAGLGDQDRAIDALQRMSPQGAVRIGRALSMPELASIRNDPRVERVRKAVGLVR